MNSMIRMSLNKMLQVLSVSLFERVALYDLLGETPALSDTRHTWGNTQLSFDDLLASKSPKARNVKQ